ncbi:acyl-CoA thioesterase [Microvirga alba]|uniref:Acyl-CoA thioesterase n=1 Tax=Microvirga alba TaxID=2791025 RepID=A0A931FRS8_9HYPH|nr:acyl-CoA thioesterase [Microvirga alba]MBF9234863.1 acyl-CoA thioesterase [Microvirga alba]
MFESSVTVEWGDCDEAGIVFYPNYFYWFDCTFQRFLRSRGLSQRELKRLFGAVTPIVDTGAKFRGPVRYDDHLDIVAAIDLWDEKRFKVAYRLSVGGTPVAEGFEVRAWAALGEDGRLKGKPVNADFKKMMM